jgi:ribosomal protein S18 acetylase RimI-like enzyme
VIIRPASATDRRGWQRLWEAYLHFYRRQPDRDWTERLWLEILDPDDPIEALVAESSDQLVGLVHYFPHPNTWEASPVCYLQDLYVDATERGKGLGSLLIRAVQHRSREAGWSSVYWQTAEDNTTARRLYDQLTGGSTGFVVYELREE